jgi:hypothetical protein
MAVGRPPFESNSFSELVELILNNQVERVKEMSDEFNDLI